MARSVCLSIAGLEIALSSADPRLELELDFPISSFAATPSSPRSVVIARYGRTDHDSRPPAFDSGGVWVLHEADGSHVYRCYSPPFGELPYKIASWSADYSEGEVVLNESVFAPSVPLNPLAYPLDEILVSNLVTRDGGVELHGCAVVVDGRALLFTGQSGAGKTTTARMWIDEPGATILSDDRVIVRPVDGEWFAFGTPWHGEAELFAAASAPLAAIFVLEQAPENALRALRPAEAVALLFGRSFPPFHDARAIQETLDTLQRVAAGIPCSVFRFRPGRGAVEMARRSIS